MDIIYEYKIYKIICFVHKMLILIEEYIHITNKLGQNNMKKKN